MLKVSVCIQTYNQNSFIAQAIDSVLMQETDFDYEIILGEDESQDGTREICIEYAKRHPDRIRLFLRSRKDVIYVNGRPTGRFNLIENLKAARGDYIALLEGDDYWTDPYKLQKQVDFLEKYLKYVICFHNVMVIYEDSDKSPHEFYGEYVDNSFSMPKPKPSSTLTDILHGNYIQTPSVIYRRECLKEIPPWFWKVDRGDWPLWSIIAQYGDIAYIDEVMASYRVHRGGIYSTRTRVQQLEGAIRCAYFIDKDYQYHYHSVIALGNNNRFQTIYSYLDRDNDIWKDLDYARSCFTRFGIGNPYTRKILYHVIKKYSTLPIKHIVRAFKKFIEKYSISSNNTQDTSARER